MKKILFLIHDLGAGGAEKVLVNLVNHLSKNKYDVTVGVLFGGGINEQFLDDSIHFYSVWSKIIPGNSKFMKVLTPKQLHKLCVRDYFDIEISYLEGPTARVISGCQNKNTTLVSWIHVGQYTMKNLKRPFRSKSEAIDCYNCFNQTICVSESVKDDFCSILNFQKPCRVLYNSVESETIEQLADEPVDIFNKDKCVRLIAVGTLKKSKGYDRLINVISKLDEEKYPVHLYVLGTGPLEQEIVADIRRRKLNHCITLLGYHTNPYRFISKCDLFVCASHSEGFSTATTEALILGIPVCTVNVSGMKEMLGKNNEYGIVTENNELALYKGIKQMIDSPELLIEYHKRAKKRGKTFSIEGTVKEVEKMLDVL
ncbi:MAG: glycosyltransferase [Blautia sp.]|uniref:glycosyltransferase n=1 Tax=Blautia sp. TaxID=1955243 RepID=UPI00259081CB|nr:glycosyltransferase [Blautia sp.]MCI7289262.1 glycosyltransferase [Blautia sp.]